MESVDSNLSEDVNREVEGMLVSEQDKSCTRTGSAVIGDGRGCDGGRVQGEAAQEGTKRLLYSIAYFHAAQSSVRLGLQRSNQIWPTPGRVRILPLRQRRCKIRQIHTKGSTKAFFDILQDASISIDISITALLDLSRRLVSPRGAEEDTASPRVDVPLQDRHGGVHQ